MKNNLFDIEIISTTTKKSNIYVLFLFIILLILSLFVNTKLFYILFIIWSFIAGGFLIYDYFHSKSIIYLSTKLLFNDDGFSIITDDNKFHLEIKKDDDIQIKFNIKMNQVSILQNDKVLYKFCVKPKVIDELVDTFHCFGYKCNIDSYI